MSSVLRFMYLLYSCVVSVCNLWKEFVSLLRLSIYELYNGILQYLVIPFIQAIGLRVVGGGELALDA